MSDQGFEAPEADAEEQHQEVLPAEDTDEEAEEAGQAGEGEEAPLEADEADRAEQQRVITVDDDEYR